MHLKIQTFFFTKEKIEKNMEIFDSLTRFIQKKKKQNFESLTKNSVM